MACTSIISFMSDILVLHPILPLVIFVSHTVIQCSRRFDSVVIPALIVIQTALIFNFWERLDNQTDLILWVNPPDYLRQHDAHHLNFNHCKVRMNTCELYVLT